MIEKLMKLLNPKYIKNNKYEFYTYCVLDGVQYPMLWSDLEEGVLEYDILFKEEKLRTNLEKVAPFLVKLDFTTQSGIAQSEELMKCYGQNGSIFFTTPLEFHETLEKMREVFYLYDENGEIEGVLRFYDPLVFSELMRESSLEIKRDIFSKVYCYWCESKIDNTLIKYMWDGTHVRHQIINIDKTIGLDNEVL